MKPFRKHTAIAIDGGGIRGIIPAVALSMLEDELDKPVYEIFELAAGTSTGSILSAGLGAGLTAQKMADLYRELGTTIFPRTLRRLLWPLTRYRYSAQPLQSALSSVFGNMKMGDFWADDPKIDVVLTTFDLVENRTRFIKPWKEEYAAWPVSFAVQASSTVPTYFPVVEGRYIDGGVGSYANPCYLAAYEALICLGWNLEETTLISLGTGREAHKFEPHQANKMWAWDWIGPALGAFLQSADDQQVHLVDTFFEKLDFRRFQINLREPIEMDDASKIDELTAYGVRLGRMMLDDKTDSIHLVQAEKLTP
jgi:predicted acylesterase/phospholipase RssA